MNWSEFRPRQREDVVKEEISDEMLLYDPERGSAVSLNASATKVWSRCDGTRTVREMSADIAAEIGVDIEAIYDDVLAAIQEFYRRGIVEASTTNSP